MQTNQKTPPPINTQSFLESEEYKLAQKLQTWSKDNSKNLSMGQHYIPHAFKNPGQNNCFINCVIQSLFACRPFVNLLRQMPVGGENVTPYHNSLKGILELFKGGFLDCIRYVANYQVLVYANRFKKISSQTMG